MKRRVLLTALLSVLLAPGGTTAAAESLMTFHLDRPIELEADEIRADSRQERYEAVGNAIMRQEGVTLNAEQVWFDKTRDEAGTEGHVRITEAGGTLEGEDLRIQVADQTAQLRQARAQLAGQGFRLAGEEIAKLGENSYRITDGAFTACSNEPPAWKFGASSVQVDVGGYARAWNVLFYLRDIPVFYLPYFLYPVKTERESGFLVPHVGFSHLRGTELFLSYYQVLGRNMDATLFLDIYSRAGLGKGLEYRYILGENNAGEFHGYHVTGIEGRQDVYAARWHHSGTLPGDVLLRADMEYVSDHEYLTDFAKATGDYNRDLVESYLYLARAWEKTDVSLQGIYRKDFSADATKPPESSLPEARVAIIPQRIAQTPLYLGLTLVENHIATEDGSVGQSQLVQPEARLVFRLWDGIAFEAIGGYRFYAVEGDEATDHLGVADLGARLSAKLQRTFRVDGATLTALRHTFEPEIGYRYVPDEAQDQFPQLMPGDLPAPGNHVTFALTNRLAARFADGDKMTKQRELAYLRLSGGYSLQDLAPYGKDFDPLRTEVALRPTDWLTLTGDARYALADNSQRWETVSAGVAVSLPRRVELALDYYYPGDQTNEYLGGRLSVALTSSLQASYQTRLLLEDREMLEQLTALEYRGQCWSVTLSYRDRPDEQEYLVNFTLAGLDKGNGFFDNSGK